MPSCTTTTRDADGRRRGDEQLDLAVLPARERVLLQVEVDAPRRHQARTAARRERQRHRRHGHGVRVVRVHDIRAVRRDDLRQPPGRGQIHLGARRQRHQIVSLAGAPVQHPGRLGDEHGPVAAFAQPEDGQEDLVLSAAPGEGGVEVE
jgi:hypothetical protein